VISNLQLDGAALQRLLEALKDEAFLLDGTGRIVLTNKAAAARVGRADGAVGKALSAVLPPGIAERIASEADRAKRQGKSVSFHALQESSRFAVTVAPLSGQPAGPQSLVLLDETTLRPDATSNEEPEEISAIALTDRHTRLVWVNETFLRMWGYPSPESLGGRPIASFWQSTEAAKEVETSLRNQGALRGDLLARRKDGSTFQARYSARLIRHEDNQALGSLWTFLNVPSQPRPHDRFLVEIPFAKNGPQERGNCAVLADAATGKILSANEWAAKLFGLPVEQLIGTHQGRFHPAKQRELANEAFRAAAKSERSSLHTGLHIIDGKGRTIPVAIRTYRAELGGRDVLLAVFHDLSKQGQMGRDILHQLEFQRTISNISARLAGGEELYHVILDCLADIGRYIQCDRVFLFRFRDGGATLINTHEWRAHEGMEEIPALRHLHRQAVAWLAGQLTEKRIVNVPDVQDLPAEAKPDRDLLRHYGIDAVAAAGLVMHGRVDGFLGLANSGRSANWSEGDISLLRVAGQIIAGALERREDTAALAASRKRFAVFMDNLTGIAFIKNDQGHYVWGNAAFERIMGERQTPWLGKTDQEIWPEEVAQALQANDRIVLETGKAIQSVEALPYAGRAHHWLINRFPLRESQNKGPMVGAIGIDVTDRRRIEAQLLHSQKMEAIGRLAGGIAHDFNNQLTVIKGYCDMIGKYLQADDPLLEPVREIHLAVERATQLTRHLLAFARQEDPHQEIISLNQLLDPMGQVLGRILGEDIRLTLLTGKRIGRIRANPAQLEQAIMNLVVNARDAMPRGGQLWIETAKVEIGEQAEQTHADITPGSYVALTVRDTGAGMDAAVRSRAFEPFFTTKAAGEGTGLGLPMVYNFMQQSGGHVLIDSAPGRGTAVTLYFPRLTARKSAQKQPDTEPAVSNGNETILLAENDAMVRKLLGEMLSREGYTVLEARDGRQAINLAEAHPGPIHLLLSDVILPEMDGPSLKRQIRRRRPDIAALYISGHDGAPAGQLGRPEEIPLLTKPFDAVELAKHVRSALDGAGQKRKQP